VKYLKRLWCWVTTHHKNRTSVKGSCCGSAWQCLDCGYTYDTGCIYWG